MVCFGLGVEASEPTLEYFVSPTVVLVGLPDSTIEATVETGAVPTGGRPTASLSNLLNLSSLMFSLTLPESSLVFGEVKPWTTDTVLGVDISSFDVDGGSAAFQDG